jgi:hypothetical protein
MDGWMDGWVDGRKELIGLTFGFVSKEVFLEKRRNEKGRGVNILLSVHLRSFF